jgi:CRP/FNR family transcriptional regulator, nitrogen fixation regulation protein
MPIAIHSHEPAWPPAPVPIAIGGMGALRRLFTEALVVSYAPGQEVVGEGDPTENYFLVVRGVFRAVNVTRDGRRQIFAFYMPGDMCGLEPDDSHALTIEAVNGAAMATLSRPMCHARMNRDPEFNAAIFENVTRALTHAVAHMTMVGRSSAEERLAWFLTMLSARGPERGGASIELTMQRQDIADYLGLTIETVSRTFTHLKARGLIALPTTRRVEILGHDLLSRLASADRDSPIREYRRLC